ncbi:hypothetical protein ACFFTM_09980 [Pseudoduganella plicata]|uniref:Uncharacterized protein n=1 Tax=Pseudoduganella plicata TaxID=321984 RepID=A0A4P7BB58_9BURK|nr:hypothetical protein [Pseudoduganella plicata]QBQ35122.1 hypothetical protein E1742_02240 [Pseudoduganella plicata]GGZ05735.1 hypothetical protein GCM10007388_44360 [Pseudoduganella plicata]
MAVLDCIVGSFFQVGYGTARTHSRPGQQEMYHLPVNNYMGIGNIYCDKHENGRIRSGLLFQVNLSSALHGPAELAVAEPFR